MDISAARSHLNSVTLLAKEQSFRIWVKLLKTKVKLRCILELTKYYNGIGQINGIE